MTWLTFAVFVVATWWLWGRTMRLYHGMDVGPRTRRLLARRMMFAVGVWQLTVAAAIVAGPGPSVNATGVGAMGLGILALGWFWKKLDRAFSL